jgi:hypothetical protein
MIRLPVWLALGLVWCCAMPARAQTISDAARGVLIVRLIGWDGLSPVGIKAAGRTSGAGHVFELGADPTVTIRGMRFERYHVWAVLDPEKRIVRGPVPVVFSAVHPEAVVDLDLRSSRARLRVSDDRNIATNQVTFANWGMPRPRRIGNGLYSLQGLPAGGALRVLGAGRLAPVCRRVPFETMEDVGLRAGRRLEIHWTPTRDAINPGWEIEAEGSNCPIFLSDLRSIQGPSNLTVEPTRVVYENFPVGRAIMRLGHRTIDIPADVDRPITITRPR